MRLTDKRRKILAVLKKHHGTLSAKELSNMLPEIDLVTIYRNLELFVAEKLIRRVHLDAGEAQYEYQPTPHHHAVCTDCNRVIHFTAPDEKIKKLLGLSKLEIEELEITVRGVCKNKSST